MKRVWIILFAVILSIVMGCGGGSEGTGTTDGFGEGRTLVGRLRDSAGSPLAGTVTLLETGDSATVDSLGSFVLGLPEDPQALTLEVDSGGTTANLTLDPIDAEVTTVKVDLTLDRERGIVSASNFHVWSRIVGDCDRYFENQPVIRQSVVLDRPLTCTMRFFVSGDGQRLERVPAAIQVRACSESRWRTIATGKTGVGLQAGVGEIDFTFIDDPRNCEYRVAAPFNVEQTDPVFVYLASLTLQSRDP
jgi:hypothetical protein